MYFLKDYCGFHEPLSRENYIYRMFNVWLVYFFVAEIIIWIKVSYEIDGYRLPVSLRRLLVVISIVCIVSFCSLVVRRIKDIGLSAKLLIPVEVIVIGHFVGNEYYVFNHWWEDWHLLLLTIGLAVPSGKNEYYNHNTNGKGVFKYIDFLCNSDGTVDRRTYNKTMSILTFVVIVLIVFAQVFPNTIEFRRLFWGLLFILPVSNLYITMRRLHDIGHSSSLAAVLIVIYAIWLYHYIGDVQWAWCIAALFWIYWVVLTLYCLIAPKRGE